MILTLLIVNLSLAAVPEHVGDFVKFHVTGPGVDYFKKSEVREFDPDRHAYLVETSETSDSADPATRQAWVPELLLYTRERGRADLADCEGFPGRPETFLLNGTLHPVCRHYFYGSFDYELVGAFPVFGRARLVSEDRGTKEELVDFSWAH